MKDALYEYRDGAGRLHTFTDIDVAYKSYKAFLKRNNLRIQDLKIYKENNKGFQPLAVYDVRSGLRFGFVGMYC